MTVSTMRCWPRLPSLLKGIAALLLLGRLLVASAGSIEPLNAALVPTEDGYALSAEFNVDLGHRVEDAVTHGIALYFNLEFELRRARWYWSNEHVAGRTLNYRLSFNPLTRQYRLGTGSLYRSFDTLAEALRAMSRVVALPVAEKGQIKPDEVYQAAVRLSLDRNQLPKPFQLDALANKDWQIGSKTLSWQPQTGDAK